MPIIYDRTLADVPDLSERVRAIFLEKGETDAIAARYKAPANTPFQSADIAGDVLFLIGQYDQLLGVPPAEKVGRPIIPDNDFYAIYWEVLKRRMPEHSKDAFYNYMRDIVPMYNRRYGPRTRSHMFSMQAENYISRLDTLVRKSGFTDKGELSAAADMPVRIDDVTYFDLLVEGCSQKNRLRGMIGQSGYMLLKRLCGEGGQFLERHSAGQSKGYTHFSMLPKPQMS